MSYFYVLWICVSMCSLYSFRYYNGRFFVLLRTRGVREFVSVIDSYFFEQRTIPCGLPHI